jgi:hypothetical protein
VEFAILPVRTNSSWTIPLMSKKIMNMLLTLLFTCLASFGLYEFGLMLMLMLSSPNACIITPGSPSHFFWDLHEIWFCPLSDPSRNSIRPDTRLQIEGRKSSTRPPSCVKFCTLIPKICWYYHLPLLNCWVMHLPLHCATTAAMQMAAPEGLCTEVMHLKLYKN